MVISVAIMIMGTPPTLGMVKNNSKNYILGIKFSQSRYHIYVIKTLIVVETLTGWITL